MRAARLPRRHGQLATAEAGARAVVGGPIAARQCNPPADRRARQRRFQPQQLTAGRHTLPWVRSLQL
eukprot:350556-Chlamydomonas_euryale.AAC.9